MRRLICEEDCVPAKVDGKSSEDRVGDTKTHVDTPNNLHFLLVSPIMQANLHPYEHERL
jgi:hypothetical protein